MQQINKSLDALQPEFCKRVKEWLQDTSSQGINLFISETLRSYSRSNELYAQGRTTPGRIVTKAKAGQSYHNFGLAVDCYPILDGHVVVDFDKSTAAMAIMRKAAIIAAKYQISWGGNWKGFKDLPHFQAASPPTLQECRTRWPTGWSNG